MSDMLEAALSWAARGVPVFPCHDKQPLVKRGVHDATTDSKTITSWWVKWPKAQVAGAMGAPSGLWAVDVDGTEGEDSLAAAIKLYGPLPVTLEHRTGRGGRHLIFKFEKSTVIGNRGAMMPKVDVRGTGGYVILPPSPGYQTLVDATPIPAPGWLVDLAKPKDKAAPKPPKPETLTGHESRRRVMGVVNAAAERIATAPEGSRNNTLVAACYSVGGYLEAGELTAEEVLPILMAAAESAQQPIETAERALRAGMLAPRGLPIDQAAGRTPPRPGETLTNERPDPLVWPMLTVKTNSSTGAETVLPSLENAFEILSFDRRWRGRIRFNELSDTYMLDKRAIEDHDVTGINLWIAKAYGCSYKTNIVFEAVMRVARLNQFNPLQEYLNGLEWDGVPRIDTWLIDYVACEDDRLSRVYGRKFMIQAVARALRPGCQADAVLILGEPKGGFGKSALIRTMSNGWTSEAQIRMGHSDAAVALQGVWLYELSELASLKKADLESIKSFTTTALDQFRPPYGRVKVTRPRSCVFIGTTNETEFLQAVDRRWWPRKVQGKVGLAALAEVRHQLWAEAVHWFKSGEAWHLTAEETELQRVDTESHVMNDPWETHIAELLEADGAVDRRVTTKWVLDKIGVPIEKQQRSDEMRAARILRGLGYDKRRVKKAGVLSWEFYK